MFERFSRSAKQVIIDARELAEDLGHEKVGTEHLLLALAGQPETTVLAELGLTAEVVRAGIDRHVGTGGVLTDTDVAALEAIGIDVQAVRARLEESFGPGALAAGGPAKRSGFFGGNFGPRAKKVLELSLREALRLKSGYIGTEHLLLALIREGEGLAARIMVDAGVDLADLRRRVEASLRAAA